MKTIIERLGKVAITVDKDLWNKDKSYDRLVLVQSSKDDICYISRKRVPAGVKNDLSDREYWIPVGKTRTVVNFGSFTILDSVNQLPTTVEEYEGPYIIDNVSYFWVGTKGDTLDGLYQSLNIKGDKGETGLSAYQSWLKYHPDATETEEEWTNTILKGEKGEDGYSAYELAMQARQQAGQAVISFEEWLESLKGKSAFERWKELHPDVVITEQQWYDTVLRGKQGEPGKNGTSIDIDTLTPEQLALIKGPKGDRGISGPRGLPGEAGASPFINRDGYWALDPIRDIDGPGPWGVKAAGSKITIGSDGYWYIDGERTDYQASGSGGSVVSTGGGSIKRITNSELVSKYGVVAGHIDKNADGHYSYESYDQMRKNAEGFTKAIMDAYNDGYAGIKFPCKYYAFCSLTYAPHSGSPSVPNALIFIHDVAGFTVDFSDSTLELVCDSSSEWRIPEGYGSYSLTAENYGDAVPVNGNASIGYVIERIAKDENGNYKSAFSKYYITDQLYSSHRIRLTKDENGVLDKTYNQFVAEATEYRNAYNSAVLIRVLQSHDVVVKNATLKGDWYTKKFPTDQAKRTKWLDSESTTGLACDGLYTKNIHVLNMDISGFSADGISNGSVSFYCYKQIPTCADKDDIFDNVYKNGRTDSSVLNNYRSTVSYVGHKDYSPVNLFTHYPLYYSRRRSTQVSDSNYDRTRGMYRVMLVPSGNGTWINDAGSFNTDYTDKKYRAISKIYARPKPLGDDVSAFSRVIQEELKKHVYTIAGPGGNTKRTLCYPRLELITYKAYSASEMASELGIDVADLQGWFEGNVQPLDAQFGELKYGAKVVEQQAESDTPEPKCYTQFRYKDYVLYERVVQTSNSGTSITVNYYKPLRILDVEYKDEFTLFPDETHIRFQTWYNSTNEQDIAIYNYNPNNDNRVLNVRPRDTTDIFIENCKFHENGRGNGAFGANNIEIRNCEFVKWGSKNPWVDDEGGLYPAVNKSTDYNIDVEDGCLRKLTIDNCIFRCSPGVGSYGARGDLKLPALLYFTFTNNTCYNCQPVCGGVYNGILSNNVFFHTNVFFEADSLDNDRFNQPVYKNIVYQNNTYYDAYITSLPKSSEYFKLKVDNCHIEFREDVRDMTVFFNAQNNPNIFKPGEYNKDIVFTNCTLVGPKNGYINGFFDTLINCNVVNANYWYVRKVVGGTLKDANLAFTPTAINTRVVGSQLHINLYVDGVTGLDLNSNIHTGYYFNNLIYQNAPFTTFVLNFYISNSEVKLKNTKYRNGVIPGYGDNASNGVISSVNYYFNNCNIIGDYDDADMANDFPLFGNLNTIVKFTSCNFACGIRSYNDAIVLARKFFNNPSNGTAIFTNCIIPTGTKLDYTSQNAIVQS